MKLVPDRIAPYAKAWVSLIGAILTLVVTAAPAVPWWVGIIPAALTAIGTYLVPNVPAQDAGDNPAGDPDDKTTVIEAAPGPIVPAPPVKRSRRKPRAPTA